MFIYFLAMFTVAHPDKVQFNQQSQQQKMTLKHAVLIFRTTDGKTNTLSVKALFTLN